MSLSKKIFLIFFFFTTALVQAQVQDENFNVSSPYHTITTHLNNLEDNNYHPEISAKTLNVIGISDKKKQQRAIELKEVLDAKGLFVDIELVPKDGDFYDSTAQKHKYILFKSHPDIYVEKVNNEWLYSLETVKAIPKLHEDAFPYLVKKLRSLFPRHSGRRFLGLTLWQYTGIVILIVLAVILYYILIYLIRNILIALLSKWGKNILIEKVVGPLVRPLSLFLIFHFALEIVPALQLPIFLAKYVILFLRISFPIYIALILYRLADFLGLFMMKFAEKTENTLDDQLAPLVERMLKTFVVIGGVVGILSTLNFNITALLTGISIGGLAFALAAQDTIKNLFGSFTIFVDRPFQVGDWIQSDNIDGTVEEVGFRSTRVRTFHNSVVYIPNGRLADMTIDNMGVRVHRRYYTRIGLTYDSTPAQLEQFVEELRKMVLGRNDVVKENFHVYVNSFEGSSIDVLFYIFFVVKDWGDELKSRQEVMLDIMKIADKVGVGFAFPTQTIHIERGSKEDISPM